MHNNDFWKQLTTRVTSVITQESDLHSSVKKYIAIMKDSSRDYLFPRNINTHVYKNPGVVYIPISW